MSTRKRYRTVRYQPLGASVLWRVFVSRPGRDNFPAVGGGFYKPGKIEGMGPAFDRVVVRCADGKTAR